MDSKLIEHIQNADKVLVGFGELFQEKYQELDKEKSTELERNDPLEAQYQKAQYIQNIRNDRTIESYKKIKEMLQEKDYFIITTCNDDKIYQAGFDKDKIVAPCGTFQYMQCTGNCSQELLTVTEEMIKEKKRMTCPHCGKEMRFNLVSEENYNEGGYMPDWLNYNKWLQSTINKNVCILELGVGFKYPSVIRWAFEKIAFYNQKAIMYRVHDLLYQSSTELKEKCISIQANPIDFFMN